MEAAVIALDDFTKRRKEFNNNLKRAEEHAEEGNVGVEKETYDESKKSLDEARERMEAAIALMVSDLEDELRHDTAN
ncbi:hypothetical protein PMAYCL1PPCAC_04626 [Pristionchus mayeri]|uniref:Uncharacterized protein n=1 Tax=Pristionchus mayeri TaxID=1317129 RepID=A0AAN5CAX8_9BILA|nr:hypothetical protein PMAYCL1PPCAC_04626 [Pristionchus mayeri]